MDGILNTDPVVSVSYKHMNRRWDMYKNEDDQRTGGIDQYQRLLWKGTMAITKHFSYDNTPTYHYGKKASVA